VFHT
jgi:hypothetical protein